MPRKRRRHAIGSIEASVRRVERMRRILDQIEVERDPVRLLDLVQRFGKLFDRGLA